MFGRSRVLVVVLGVMLLTGGSAAQDRLIDSARIKIGKQVTTKFKTLLKKRDWEGLDGLFTGTKEGRAREIRTCKKYRSKLLTFPIAEKVYLNDSNSDVTVCLKGPKSWVIDIVIDPLEQRIQSILTNDD